MKKCFVLSVLVLLTMAVSIGCKSSASNCFTRNGSRVPTGTTGDGTGYGGTVAPPTYPVENVIYAAPTAGSCNPCAPNACEPIANACDPCGASRTGAGYPQSALPGLN